MTKEKLTVNELFSGIGAQRKALERLGIEHEVVGIAEIDKYALQSYFAMYGETHNYGDISKAERLNYADLWTYSFPCQDISVAGKQKGINQGTRSGLLYEVQRLLEVAKAEGTLPKYLLLENVKNLVSKKFKSQFDNWLFYLQELGYNNYWQVLNAKNYGIPQNRERVFAISIRKDLNETFEFPKAETLTKKLADILENEVDEKYYLSEAIQNRFKLELKGKNIVGTTAPSSRTIGQRDIVYSPNGVIGSLVATDYKQPKQIIEMPCKDEDRPFLQFDKEGVVKVREAVKKGYSEATVGDSINMAYMNSKLRRGRVGHGVAQTLTTKPEQVVVEKEKIVCEQRSDEGLRFFKNYAIGTLRTTDACGDKRVIELPCIAASRGRNPDNPSDRTVGAPTEQRLEINTQGTSNTITTVQKDNYVVDRILQIGNIVKTGNWENPQRGRIYSSEGLSPTLTASVGGGKEPKIVEGIKIRKLTPLECWRLMGFDDEDFKKAQSSGVSNSQLYKQAGNSIVVNVLEKIFKNLFRK